MAAFLLALVLVLLLDQASPLQRAAGRAGDSGAALGTAAVAIVAGVALTAVTTVVLGTWFAPMLAPRARLLFLAFALVFGGAGLVAGALRARRSSPPVPMRPDAMVALIAMALLRRAGGNGVFATLAVTAAMQAPVLTGAGALIGGIVANIAPLGVGSRPFDGLAARAMRGCGGVILLITAAACAVQALRLVAN